MDKETRYRIIGEWPGGKHQLSSDLERPNRNSIHHSAICWSPCAKGNEHPIPGSLHNTITTFTQPNVDAWVKVLLKDCLNLVAIHVVVVKE